MIKEFNSRFYNEEHYKDGHTHPLLLEKEENRDCSSPFFREVLEFCVHSDVVKTTGMSLMDLMNLDLASFLSLKEVVLKENERRAALLDKEAKIQQQRQAQLVNQVRR